MTSHPPPISESSALSSSSDSDSESLKDTLIHLKSDNSIVKERLREIQEDLVDSKNELDRCHDILRAISSLRKQFIQPPPEILLMIFDRTIPPAFLVDASASHTLNPVWGKVLQQKIAIVNVCRTWHRLLRLLRTLENPATDISKYVKAVSFNCLVPKWFGSQFEQRLKFLFHLCPKIISFSYLSSCPLPSTESLSVLPSHVTHLELAQGVSWQLLVNVLGLVSLNIIALSIHAPLEYHLNHGPAFNFCHLEELSFGVTSSAVLLFNHFYHNWKVPMLTRLTFRMHGSWESGVSAAFIDFCERHANVKLKFLHVYPEYGWSMPQFTVDMQSLLDLCPNLEHIVVHPRTIPTLTHQRVKWVDIWTSHAVTSCELFWQSIRDNVTLSSFPSLQGIRCLSSSLAFARDLPLVLPPGHVLTPLDSFAYTFLDLDVRHDVGEIYRVLPWEDEASDEDDGDFVMESWERDSESSGSCSLDWDIQSERDHSRTWDADMDALN